MVLLGFSGRELGQQCGTEDPHPAVSAWELLGPVVWCGAYAETVQLIGFDVWHEYRQSSWMGCSGAEARDVLCLGVGGMWYRRGGGEWHATRTQANLLCGVVLSCVA